MMVKAGKIGLQIPQLTLRKIDSIRIGDLASKLTSDSRKLARHGIMLGLRVEADSGPQLIFGLDSKDVVKGLDRIINMMDPTIRRGRLSLSSNTGATLKNISYVLHEFLNLVEGEAHTSTLGKGTILLNNLIPDLSENQHLLRNRGNFLGHIKKCVVSLDQNYLNTLKSIEKDIGASHIIELMRKINRGDFIPLDSVYRHSKSRGIPSKYLYFIDCPLYLNADYNASRISTIAIVLEALNAEKGMNVLEIGTGSGWPTALLSDIIGPEGKVYTVEILNDLFAWSKRVLEEKGLSNVRFKNDDGLNGWKEKAPFDRIVVWGSMKSVKDSDILFDQLKEGGLMIIPVSDVDVLIISKVNGRHSREIPIIARLSNNWFGDLK